jgi:hypothetical protein
MGTAETMGEAPRQSARTPKFCASDLAETVQLTRPTSISPACQRVNTVSTGCRAMTLAAPDAQPAMKSTYASDSGISFLRFYLKIRILLPEELFILRSSGKIVYTVVNFLSNLFFLW